MLKKFYFSHFRIPTFSSLSTRISIDSAQLCSPSNKKTMGKKNRKQHNKNNAISDPYDFGGPLQFVESTLPSQLEELRGKYKPINADAVQFQKSPSNSRNFSSNSSDNKNLPMNVSNKQLFDASIVNSIQNSICFV